MQANYVTREDDVLDLICLKYYQSTDGTVEAVLAANPHSASVGPYLPAGITLIMPNLATPNSVVRTVSLWD